MSVQETCVNSWAHFFKPEVRKQGSDIMANGTVVLSQASDTGILAYVRTSIPVRVSFSAASIASENFSADCSCPLSVKGQFCKHVWATLLLVEKSYPDFLDSKKDIIKAALDQAPAKTKQSDYKTQQYQRQKQWSKDRKRETKKGKADALLARPSYPSEVESALTYFSENGFPMEPMIDEQLLNSAKKILSRVFHPDKGGTHEEILTLNRNFDILVDFLQS